MSIKPMMSLLDIKKTRPLCFTKGESTGLRSSCGAGESRVVWVVSSECPLATLWHVTMSCVTWPARHNHSNHLVTRHAVTLTHSHSTIPASGSLSSHHTAAPLSGHPVWAITDTLYNVIFHCYSSQARAWVGGRAAPGSANNCPAASVEHLQLQDCRLDTVDTRYTVWYKYLDADRSWISTVDIGISSSNRYLS